ncbi:MAG TPA: hypothetical protein VJK02_25395 [Anaerolineales bacterium]|nr:hypothetical protein [Anaerolineales bacterium]
MSELKERKSRPLNNEKGLEVLEAGIYAALVIAGAIVLLGPIGIAVNAAWGVIQAAL